MMDPEKFVEISREAYRKCGRKPVQRAWWTADGGACVLAAHCIVNLPGEREGISTAIKAMKQKPTWIFGVLVGWDGGTANKKPSAEYENGYACGLAARKAFLEV
jgi:hypothetical protein